MNRFPLAAADQGEPGLAARGRRPRAVNPEREIRIGMPICTVLIQPSLRLSAPSCRKFFPAGRDAVEVHVPCDPCSIAVVPADILHIKQRSVLLAEHASRGSAPGGRDRGSARC